MLSLYRYGFSRDDASNFLPGYLDKKVVEQDPFSTLDPEGTHTSVDIAAAEMLEEHDPELLPQTQMCRTPLPLSFWNDTACGAGVGVLMRTGVDNCRKNPKVTNQDIKFGICGEHGGDPKSVRAHILNISTFPSLRVCSRRGSLDTCVTP